MPADQLLLYKKSIMVHFGYDKKDAPPTTFSFIVDFGSICIHFSDQNYGYIADVKCSNFVWSLKKFRDRISRQQLTCESIELIQTSGNKKWGGFEKLLFPLLQDDISSSPANESQNINRSQRNQPQLLYKSTSRPNGDNVKYLEVNNACIYFIYLSWKFVFSFFQDLPEPGIMEKDEVLNSLQIGDRWYKIDKHSTNLRQCAPNQEDAKPVTLDGNNVTQGEERPTLQTEQPSFQFRVVLFSPRIVLVSDASVREDSDHFPCKAVTLQLSHLDYLHKNDSS